MLSAEETERFDRHLILEGVGREGQEKLKKAKILIIGAGGLGSPVAMYLTAAGVGTLGIADGDVIERSNLQRQVLYSDSEIGMYKAERAAVHLMEKNPALHVNVYRKKIDTENIRAIVRDYDFIIDGVDNFPGKFLINDACVLEKKPFCHAGVVQFHGQVMTFVPGQGPCYRCIFEEIPPAGTVGNCSRLGVMGAMVGVIGSIQALEAVKYIVGAGELLTGKLLTVDGLSMEFRKVNFSRGRKDCPVCGENPTITETSGQWERYMEK